MISAIHIFDLDQEPIPLIRLSQKSGIPSMQELREDWDQAPK